MIAKLTSIFRSRDLPPILFLIAWPCVYFFQITLGQGVWFGDDIVMSYFPSGLELSRALAKGGLPFWTTGVGAGYPMLAEGQTGPLYPVNWLLYKLLPVEMALSYGMLLHLILLACGMYWCARAFGLGRPGATLAGLIGSFNSFTLTQLVHPNVIQTMAWLPWLILGERMFHRAERRAAAFLLMACAVAMQWLAGFPQVTFMTLLAFGLWGVFDNLTQSNSLRGSLQGIFTAVGLPLLVGTGIAAAQIVPTVELIGYSVRSSGLALGTLTSYSLSPEYLAQFLFPFAFVEPSPFTSEYFTYIGITAFLLAALAPVLQRNRQTIFLTLFALSTVSLALGEHNPIFVWLARVPPFDLFRVPTRYLHLALFAAALLCATSFDEILRRLTPSSWSLSRTVGLGLAVAVPILGVIALGQNQPLEFWLELWRVLPLFFIVLAVIILWMARARRIDRRAFTVLVLGFSALDLACFAAPLFPTTYRVVQPEYTRLVPRSVEAVQTTPQDGRVFSDQSVYPIFPGTRNSLMPNTNLIYDKSSALIYSSLPLTRYQDFVNRLSLEMFNLLNVRYYTMSLIPRPRSKSLAPPWSLSHYLLDKETAISPTLTSAIEMVSFTEWGNEIADQTPVANLLVHIRNGKTQSFPIRLGIETADWDYDLKEQPHARAPVARSFPAFWRSVGRSFDGHTYEAHFQLESASEIDAIDVQLLQPGVGLTIESMTLRDERGQAISLAQLMGKIDFTPEYLSDTVAIWKNPGALPRAFIVHSAEIANDDQTLARLSAGNFPADRSVLLSDGKPMDDHGASGAQDRVEITRYESERVGLSAQTDRAGYLFLGDTWYPGWNASVDGKPVPIYRADFLFRAVPIEPGQHTVVFQYQPMSFWLGAILSALSLIATGIISIFILHRLASNS